MTQRNMDQRELLEAIIEEKRKVYDEGRPDDVEKQHQRGSLTARERVDYLCDDDTFDEVGLLAGPSPTTPEVADWDREEAPADGMVTGFGEIDGRPVAICANDYTVKGGSYGTTANRKQSRVFDVALDRGLPVIMLQEGTGRRIQEGLDARTFAHGGSGMLQKLQQLSGWVPTIGAIMGQGFGGPTNSAVMCDFVPVIQGKSTMGVAGPALLKAAMGVDLEPQDYAGSDVHTVQSGMADIAVKNDEACLDTIGQYLSYLPQNARHDPPEVDNISQPRDDTREQLLDVVPPNPRKAYDIQRVIEGIVDRDSTMELKPKFAPNIVTMFARIDGEPVGIVANNPRIKAGSIDGDAADKAAKFISFCDAFGLPLVYLADIPGTLPGPDAEKNAVAQHAAKMLYELSRATVPIVNVIVRRAYGLGHLLMAGGVSGNNVLSIVWPTAEISVMGVEGAVDIAYGREIESADDPEQRREELIDKFLDKSGALRAAEGAGIDAVIDPRETRDWVCRALNRSDESLERDWPPKKHGINPL